CQAKQTPNRVGGARAKVGHSCGRFVRLVGRIGSRWATAIWRFMFFVASALGAVYRCRKSPRISLAGGTSPFRFFLPATREFPRSSKPPRAHWIFNITSSRAAANPWSAPCSLTVLRYHYQHPALLKPS